MAPEQRHEAPEDERTDVFALGVILHQLLAGSLPFEREKQAAGNGRAPTLEVPGAPALGELVGRMLEKDPLRRPRDAGKVLSALERAMAGMAPVAPGPVRARRHPRWRMTALVAAGAALGLGGLLAWDHLRRLRSAGERIPVAVADVVNETGERDLDVLSGLLVTSLEQSRRLAVLTQARVLDLAAKMGRKDATRVDEAMGREVGKERGVRALLLPAVRRLGTTYAVEMRAVDPVKDEHLFTVSDRASSKEGLLDLLDRLSDRTRRELKEDEAELERSRIALGTAMTRSLEAYQHYAAGIEARYRDGMRSVALREQLRAVELDPEFAAAQWQLARIYKAYGRGELSGSHWQVAMRYGDRMPDKERTLLRMVAREHAGDLAEAERLAIDLVARYPDDKFVLYMTGGALRKPEVALPIYRRIVDLDPAYVSAIYWMERRGSLGEEEELQLLRRAVAARRGPMTLAYLAGHLVRSGAREDAAVLARESLRLNGGRSVNLAADACLTLWEVGASAECLRALEYIKNEGLNEFERDQACNFLTTKLLLLGRVREAIRLNEASPHPLPNDIHAIGRARHASPEALAFVRSRADRTWLRNDLAWFGDLEGAARVDASMTPGDRNVDRDQLYQALVAVHERRYDEALRTFRESVRRDQERKVNGEQSLYLLAETLLAAGRPSEAAEVRVSWPPATALEYDEFNVAAMYPRHALVRARALEKLGRRAEAVKELDALLGFWKEADDDLPLLVEAKAMRKRLAAAPGSR